MEYQTHILDNGLRIIHKPSQGYVSYCGYIINAGTRDEEIHEFGMAHFVEHMLFKGTKRRKAYHIINRMESVGGELNAYTNKEETVIYTNFLEKHIDRAIDLLTDIVHNSVFPEQEIEKEINVVIDEIHSYEDNPSELIYDEFENLVFQNTQLGHNILGLENVLETFNSEKVNHFFRRNYRPENMVFFSLGRTPLKKIVKILERISYPEKIAINSHTRQKTTISAGVSKIIDKHTNQGHVMLGYEAYKLDHPKRKILQLLNNILGGNSMNSRLNMILREKKGYVYNVDSSLTSYTDIGLFSIYFGCDPKNIHKCIELTQKEINTLKNKKLSDTQIRIAKNQMIGQIAIAADNSENLALSLGKSFLHFNKVDSLDEIVVKINQISADNLLEVANEIFTENKSFSLIYQ